MPEFEGIRIHAGNTMDDTRGCLICGSFIGEGGESVIESCAARDKLYAKIEAAFLAGEEISISII